VQADWEERAAQVIPVPVAPLKKDVLLDRFGILWLPYWQIKNPDGLLDLAAW
jgi:hypothetical protein